MKPKMFIIDSINRKRPSWIDYQAVLKRNAAQKRIFKNALKYIVLPVILLFAVYELIQGLGGLVADQMEAAKTVLSENKADTSDHPEPLISKREVQALLDNNFFINLKENHFEFTHDGQNFQVDTSIDIPLQNYILKKMDRKNSRRIGVVVLEPLTGKVLTMAGFDKTNPSNNPCLDNRFPAASIFKIITAAAAIEKCGFAPNTTLKFNGRKYTLYKSQLRERTNKYTARITLQDSFAQSVNPVFGKIGSLYLKKSALQTYASAFGFNRDIDFELPLSPSFIKLTDEPYHWAEIASGFNRETLLSPLHGALISSALLNSGMLVEPTIVDQVTDENGQAIYQSRLTPIHQACKKNTSIAVKKLMHASIRSGTCRKAFRGYRKDPVLSRLNIGGKSGSIYNRSHDTRFDWFVGFAEEKEGYEKIAVSVVIAHGKYIGKRATRYGRILIKQHFGSYFANKKRTIKNDFLIAEHKLSIINQ